MLTTHSTCFPVTFCNSLFAITLFLPLLFAHAQSSPNLQRWDFQNVPHGSQPPATEAPTGSWIVRDFPDAPAGTRAVVQTAANDRPVFNLLVFKEPAAKDLDLRVSFRALEGKIDQGGGLAWRYQDARNYYIARFNPLENNFRLYKVVAGTRQQLATADVTLPSGWHTLRITMRGNRIECFLNGKSYLTAIDDTFSQPGRIGLWTKADAVTAFDDLQLQPLS